MALLKTSGLIGKISGKLGGSVLGVSSSGQYIKRNAYNVQSNTTRQSLQRTKVGLVTQNWRNLTVYQKSLWSDQVINYPYINRVGEEAFYNGYQLHNFINSNLFLLGLPMLNVPAIFVEASAPYFQAYFTNNTNIEVYYQDVNSDESVVVYATIQSTQNRAYKNTNQRLIGIVNNTSTSGEVNITSMYTNYFGPVNASMTIFVSIKTINRLTGITSRILDFKQVFAGN